MLQMSTIIYGLRTKQVVIHTWAHMRSFADFLKGTFWEYENHHPFYEKNYLFAGSFSAAYICTTDAPIIISCSLFYQRRPQAKKSDDFARSK